MGRTPTRNMSLPAGMRARHRGKKVYYYLDTGAKPRREIPLGQDYVIAVQKWAELQVVGKPAGEILTFRSVAESYMKKVLPTKSTETQKDNLRELAFLYKFFDAPPVALEDIEPVMVRQYLTWRVEHAVEMARAKNAARAAKSPPRPQIPIKGNEGHVRANREKALLSHIWNFARETGLTALPNPCAGIKGHKERGRDIYIDDEVLQAVWDVAEPGLRDALDMAYLTGQRPADVRKMTRTDIQGGAVSVQQNKTGKRLRVAIEGALGDLIQRIRSRKVASMALIAKVDGTRMTKSMLRGAFDRARIAAVAAHPELADRIRAFQFRDLRAKAGTDTEDERGMAAAKDQLGHSTEAMTTRYVRHRRGKLVKPTK